jgi:hypothetical protein
MQSNFEVYIDELNSDEQFLKKMQTRIRKCIAWMLCITMDENVSHSHLCQKC